MIKLCVVCGKPFEARQNKNMCSPACILKRRREYMSVWRRSITIKAASVRKCEWCGRVGLPLWCMRYCSNECGRLGSKRERNAAQSQKCYTCAVCGKLFRKSVARKTCSVQCSNQLRYETQKRWCEHNRESRRESARRYTPMNADKCRIKGRYYKNKNREEYRRRDARRHREVRILPRSAQTFFQLIETTNILRNIKQNEATKTTTQH